ncbi:CarD family transcriptional regulator [Intestinibacillus massiliensis]|uniref:CarD family transcriptional regulator n=1 Tax=Intestinibacillus massiliensis TaxID=1871029 RepID=UPI001F314D7E|nr:CarD family transcriptional regulator [Intestinibacillus massiliensis]
MHGAGVIEEIVDRKIDGESVQYYALKLILDDVVLFVPVKNSEEIGLRPVCSRADAQELIGFMGEIGQDEDKCWNRRYRENMLRIRSGDIHEVAKVVKNLMRRNGERGLSTGEKKMLGSAQRILVSELALALADEPGRIEEILDKRLCL